jgi:hypothetical protein
MYKSELAEKAKKEYDEWVARKDEREGRREDGEGNCGAQEWVPRERTQARFGELNQPVAISPIPPMGQGSMSGKDGGYGGQAALAGYPDPYGAQYPGRLNPQTLAQEKAHFYGMPQGVVGTPGAVPQPQQGYDQYDPAVYPYQQQHQQYWDPMAYWWMMAQMGMLSLEDMQALQVNGLGMGVQGDGISPITSERDSQGSSEEDQCPP